MIAFAVDVLALDLDRWPLDPAQIRQGTPEISGQILDVSADGRVQCGVWQHTPGVTTDVEDDELFVVLTGRATIEIEGGPTLHVGPGYAGVLRRGDRTVWTIHETLRKVYQSNS